MSRKMSKRITVRRKVESSVFLAPLLELGATVVAFVKLEDFLIGALFERGACSPKRI